MKKRLERLRETRFFRWKGAGPLLAGLFPVVLCIFAELGQMQDLSDLLAFTWTSFGVFVFSCLVIAVVFWFFALVVRRIWISGAITGTLFMVISAVEYHKYVVTGSHFQFTDLYMATGFADVSKFARLKFNPLLFVLILLTILYVAAMFVSGYRLKGRFWKQCSMAVVMAGITAIAILVPAFFAPVCQVFGIDDTVTYNSYSEDARFDHNNLITNFTVSINQSVKSTVAEPAEYSEEAIEELLSNPSEDQTAMTEPQETVKPNVVFIMSESYADFRRLYDMDNGEEIYQDFDEVCAEGTTGTSIVPTFGNGTVRTEFELMFGLPVKSLNNVEIPHKLLKSGVEQDTFANMYKEAGYNTTYIHPFRSNFYDREEVYSEYGFDRMIFEDDFTVDTQLFRDYINDDTAFRQAEAVMKSTEGPDYIHITTMQNHQPYIDDQGEEVDNYFDGIQASNEALRDFTNRLKESDEPTIIVFTGDHFPFFSPESSFYNEIGINVDNCSKLYEKTWLVWSNFDLDTSSLPTETISTFYLPHLIYRLAGQENPFVDTMLEEMAQEPVYSVAVNPTTESELLDMLTYDRVIGENYSEVDGRMMNFND